MAGKRKRLSSSSLQHFPIGNCKVEVEGGKFICESSNQNTLQISVNQAAKIKITVDEGGDKDSNFGDHSVLVINPKDIDSSQKSLLQEVLRIYEQELPAMNYAANTGKQSRFLEKCVFNGKYCTLLLKSNAREGTGQVVAAVTYQILPADTQYAEIPLAAVCSNYQHKGIGIFLYVELRRRLQNIGICTIFCWGDKESEGFWLKQGFLPIAEVDSNGKACRLKLKASIRKALCFPGGSTLMVSHLNNDIGCLKSSTNNSNGCFPLTVQMHLPKSTPSRSQELQGTRNSYEILHNSSVKEGALLNVTVAQRRQTENPRPLTVIKDGCPQNDNKFDGFCPDSVDVCETLYVDGAESDRKATVVGLTNNANDADGKGGSCSGQGVQKRILEASLSSLKSKKIRAGHSNDCQVDYSCDRSLECDQANNSCFKTHSLGTSNNSCFKTCSLGASRDRSIMKLTSRDTWGNSCLAIYSADSGSIHSMLNTNHVKEVQKGERPQIMLMNIADDAKKTFLTKIIEDLGGSVTSDGSLCTHVVTGKARRTMNFCTALCSGAWVLSTTWLKTSFREGIFVDEFPFLLQDEDYLSKYKSDLKDAVLRAKAHPQSLLKGYEICLAKHVQPPKDVLSAIIKSAGGQVLHRLSEVKEPSRTIFVSCEEDMEDALVAAKRGIWTYSSDWFMSCVMKQELDLEAPQFAESL